MRKTIIIASVLFALSGGFFALTPHASAGGGCGKGCYGEGYYQGYYYSQGYYYGQGYYQGYYYSQGYYYAEGYYQGYYYSQGYYYTQGYYYSQGSYSLTFTKNATITGNLTVTGGLSKGSGTFLIDDPIDPKNKMLYHSFVESPDVKNIYDGTITLDKNGEAVVKLPAYFQALNKDFRYQAKGLDKPAPNLYIKKEVADNQFTIAGGPAGAEVSWQVTGIRHDPYILANPIVPEVEKGDKGIVARGQYLFSGYADQSFLAKLGQSVHLFLERLSIGS